MVSLLQMSARVELLELKCQLASSPHQKIEIPSIEIVILSKTKDPLLARTSTIHNAPARFLNMTHHGKYSDQA